MVRGKGTTASVPGTEEFRRQMIAQDSKKALSESEISQLEDERRELENVLSEASDKDRAKGVDTAAIQRRIGHIDKVLLERDVPEAKGPVKDKLIREEKDIEDKL